MKIILKFLIRVLSFIMLFIINLYAFELGKIDLKLKALMQDPQLNKLYYVQRYGISKAVASPYTTVILKTSATVATLTAFDVRVQAKIGDIVTATVAIDRLADLAQLPEVRYIQAPSLLSTLTNRSVPEIRAPLVYQNYGVSGAGIIIGIIDTGIDWHHQDFRKADGKTRIKYLLDFSYPGDINGDDELDGPDAFGGTLNTEQEINNALTGSGIIYEDDVVGHGTHVAGCAAGNGLATGNFLPAKTYVGVAPEAEIIVVKATRVQGSTGFVSNDYINALAFIDSIAGVEGKPYVANMSLGGNDGPHDGTALGEQAIDQLVGTGISGKAVVISAGNDGNHDIHASGTLTSSSTSIETDFKIDSYVNNPSTYDDYVLFEMWYDGAANHSIKLTAPDGTAYGPITKGNQFSTNSNNGAIYIDNASNGKNPFNLDNQAIIQIFDYEAGKPPKSGGWKITITGTSGRFDLWLTSSSMTAYLSSNIDKSMIVATPGTAKNAITVGSYVTTNQWTDLDGHVVQPVPLPTLYDASSFSSPGPTRDGRKKPEISAPGEMIASSYSQDAPPNGEYSMFDTKNENLPNGYICPDGVHAYAQGTSFSAPHVTGVVALMLEKYPQLDAKQIKDALTASARSDEYTQSVPNDKWGYGKLDAYAAMQYIAGGGTEKKFSLTIFQNPALTQYIDFYLISKYSLLSLPTASIQIGNSRSDNITMTEIDSLIFKGEYQFTSDGTAVLTINATIQGESTTTLTKYFEVQLLKANLGGIVAFDKVKLIIPQNSFHYDTYFTIFPVAENLSANELQAVGNAYQLGPSDYSFDLPITLHFNYNDAILPELDESKLAIYARENDNWKQLKSMIDTDRNVVTTTTNRLGTYRLFYDPNSDLTENLPKSFMIYPNFPNPFNASTTIKYQLPHEAHISIKIFNIKGELVTTLFKGVKQPGNYKILWDGKDINKQPAASGLYLCSFFTAEYSKSYKMLLLK